MNKLIKISVPTLLALGLVLITGCSAGAPPFPEMPPAMESAPPLPGMMKEAVDEDEYRYSGGGYNEGGIDRKIVKTGYLTLEVNDVADTMDEVAGMASNLSGYVVSSNKHEDNNRIYGRVSIRVPAERFDEAFDRLRQLAIDVPYESTDSRDITEEYSDLEAQLHNLEATEAQYLTLLEKAKTVEDILKVQRELSRVRGEIEQIKGRMQYLERTSDMSLIEVSLQETRPLGAGGWSVLATLKSAVDGLISFGKVLANIVIWLVIFCPFWIPIIFLVRFLRRRKAKA